MVTGNNHPSSNTKPRLFYGYVIVIAACFIMIVSWSVYNAFGVFFKPLLNDFGWTRAMTSGAFSLSMIVYGVLGIVVGGLNDKIGPRLVLTLCGILLGAGYLLMSQVNDLWQIYLFYGIMIGVGMSGVWVPQLSTIARWFIKRRTLMTGIVLAGASIGQLIGPPIASRLIIAYDWRQSYIILGSVVLLAMVLAAQFLRRDPTTIGQQPYGDLLVKQPGLSSFSEAYTLKEAACTSQFWIAFSIFACFGFGAFTITVHIVPHAIELGIAATSAANILATRGGISILGNYVLGNAADRIGNRKIFIIGFVLMAAALLWLSISTELWMLYLFILFFSFASGGMGASESPLVAGLFGLKSHGLIYGVVHLGFTVGAAAGPVLTGYVFDVSGSYQAAFLASAALCIVGIILAATLRPIKVKQTRGYNLSESTSNRLKS
ncbi:MFS transporter [Chloroflexota bacterium]